MADKIQDILAKMAAGLPKHEPVPPSQFALGVAEQLRDIAAQIETGDLVVTHISFTTHSDSARQRLELEVA